jgi:hypothetical protein
MSIKKILDENTGQEIAGAIFLPGRITQKQKAKADQDLAEYRRRRRETMAAADQMSHRLMQLKFRLENYIEKGKYDPAHDFRYFRDQYLRVTGRKKKEFANDIQIHQALLSNIIKSRREPNESIMIRLEIHSQNTIPAIDWFKLHEMKKGYQINTNEDLRKRESCFVTRRLQAV